LIFTEVIYSSPSEKNDGTNINNVPNIDEVPMLPQEPLRKSQRERKSAISDDYIVYLTEDGCDLGHVDDPVSFKQAIMSRNSSQSLEAMNDEMKSMEINEVWDLVELPVGVKPVGFKWVYKAKIDSQCNVERYKTQLVAKGFTQQQEVHYDNTFSPDSKKDSLRIVLALVAHYNLELHQMDVKTIFLNSDLHEEIYMKQPKDFIVKGKEHMGCRLKRSIYGLKQASRQWYLKFDQVITEFGFKENTIDQCIYLKISGSKFNILILYVEDILLASSALDILFE
jgi:Reverse transcriptase (RNA-dependent DNA polymerase)